jgi:hypothetical protein
MRLIIGLVVTATLATPTAQAQMLGTPVGPPGTPEPSSAVQCQDAATWLADTATRVDPLFLPIYPNTSDFSLATYWEALATAQRDLRQSQPPLAATPLNDQIQDVLQILLAGANQAGDITAMVGFGSTDPRFQSELQEMLSLSRQLKRTCQLVESAQFFDAACYGPQAAEWYRRTYLRSLAFAQLANKLQQENAAVPASDETREAFIARMTGEFEPLFRAQEAEVTPLAMRALQQRYLDVFALMTTV